MKSGALKHRWYLDPVIDMVKRGDGCLLIVSGVRYGGGAYIVKYMYETYGSERVVRFFKALSHLSFSEALIKEFNVTLLEFEEHWLDWATKEFNVSRDLSPSPSKRYAELETAYSRLKADYEELKTAHETLKADYESLKSNYERLRLEFGSTINLVIIFIVMAILLIIMAYLIRKEIS